MKNFKLKSIAFSLFICLLSSCSLASRIKKEVDKSQQPHVLKSIDNTCQITVPGNWQKLNTLNENAVIQGGNLRINQYVMVIRDDKADTGKKITLDSVTEFARSNFKESAADAVLTEPISTTVNNFPARQFEASGEADNVKTKYVYGIVETPNNYYQIITWSLNSTFEANRSIFLEVIGSFREIGYGEIVPATNTETNTKK